jgi:hypothetical protein
MAERVEVFLGSGKADAVFYLEATTKGFEKEKEKVRVGRGKSEA